MSDKSVKKYVTVFNKKYSEEFPFIVSSKKGSIYAYCTSCRIDFSVANRGRGDIVRHIDREKHKSSAACVKENAKICFTKKSEDYSVIRAESLFTAFIVEHNLPICAAYHAGLLFRKMFPDSAIAKNYGCARTKTSAIIGEMAHSERQHILEAIRENVFSLATDGSNKGELKLYPLVVTFFKEKDMLVQSSLLAAPVLEDDATGINIANLLMEQLKVFNVPAENCLSLGVDNAPVMIGQNKGVAGVLKKDIPDLYVHGCLCHLLNLAAQKGSECLPISIEEDLVDIFYYLDKSVKRKESLKKFQELCDVEVQKILKHVSTRWLSVSRCVERILNQWAPLTSFFRQEVNKSLMKNKETNLEDFKIPKLKVFSGSKDEVSSATPAESRKRVANSNTSTTGKKQKTLSFAQNSTIKKNVLSREERLFMFLSSDLNRAFVQFLLNVIPLFEIPNAQLQTDEPKIHILKTFLFDTYKNVLIRFVRPDVIKKAKCLLDIDFNAKQNQKIDSELVIGHQTKDILSSLSNDDQQRFYSSIRDYFVRVCNYMFQKFPFTHGVLVNAEVADLKNISSASFSNIKFFVDNFPVLVKILGKNDRNSFLDILETQFCALQCEDLSELYQSTERIDMKWAKVCNMKGNTYSVIAKFMLAILTIPHSNATCERIFSYVTKIQTQFRSSISSQNLEKLVTVKVNQKELCFQNNFDDTFLKNAKSATVAVLKQSYK